MNYFQDTTSFSTFPLRKYQREYTQGQSPSDKFNMNWFESYLPLWSISRSISLLNILTCYRSNANAAKPPVKIQNSQGNKQDRQLRRDSISTKFKSHWNEINKMTVSSVETSLTAYRKTIYLFFYRYWQQSQCPRSVLKGMFGVKRKMTSSVQNLAKQEHLGYKGPLQLPGIVDISPWPLLQPSSNFINLFSLGMNEVLSSWIGRWTFSKLSWIRTTFTCVKQRKEVWWGSFHIFIPQICTSLHTKNWKALIQGSTRRRRKHRG